MNEHTQGKLSLIRQYEDAELRDAAGNLVAVIVVYSSPADDRRIVAAWNACQGIPTEVLEAQQSGGLPWRVADQIEARGMQAELVAALRMAIGAMRAPIDGWKGDVEAAALQVANAAIARATGGAS